MRKKMNAKVFILLALLVVVLLIIFYVNSRKNKAKDIAVKYFWQFIEEFAEALKQGLMKSMS